MPPSEIKTDFDTKTLLNDHGKDITGLGERVAKCYSQDRYEEFQTAVERIALKTMGGKDGVKEIKEHATEATKNYLTTEKWKQKTLWIPVVVSVISAIASIAFSFL